MKLINSTKSKFLFAALALGALPFAASCSSLGYGDPNATETVSINFGSTDLQSLSSEMVESLVTSPSMTYLNNPAKGDDPRIIVVFGGIDNRTTEHLDTGGIADKIRVQLLKTGKYRWVASDQGRSEIADEVRYQQGSGFVNPAMAAEMGKQLGAEVVIYGSLRSIKKRKDSSIESGGTKTTDVYYQFVLNAVNVETAEILWADEAELRKTKRTGIFGR